VQPDAALAAVVGKDPLPRTELTKKLWEYIRKHELQDPKDKRSIRADENYWRYSTPRRLSRCSR
jgi:upstream activation factor subunit UAF30